MPLSQDFIDYATELIAGFGKVDVKRMFGGATLSRNGVGFGILDNDTFFLKADKTLGAELNGQGSKPWSYSVKKDGTVRDVAYWSLPAAAADDPDEALELVKRSFVIATQAAKEKPRKQSAKQRAPARKTARARSKATGNPRAKK
jgi:DNA transformation protein